MNTLGPRSHGHSRTKLAGLIKLKLFSLAATDGCKGGCVSLRMPEKININLIVMVTKVGKKLLNFLLKIFGQQEYKNNILIMLNSIVV